MGAGFLQTGHLLQNFRKRGKENLFLITKEGKSMSDKKAAQQIHPLKTPRAAGVAGILFAVLFATSIVLTRLAVPEELTAGTNWLTEGRPYITIVLMLMPFAGIAFLWFVGVIRDLLGEYEDKFFSSIYIGSSLLFIAMIFVATALGGALVASFDFDRARAVSLDLDVIVFSRAVMLQISNVYAMRMAGVFMTSLGVVWFRTRLVPRWLTFITFALAFMLLVVISSSLWVTLVVPAWTFLASLYILLANPQTSNKVQPEDTRT
jgi:hypothetical protein